MRKKFFTQRMMRHWMVFEKCGLMEVAQRSFGASTLGDTPTGHNTEQLALGHPASAGTRLTPEIPSNLSYL